MRFGRRDVNHREIREAFRDAGASVFDTGDVGGGFPDLVVGWRGQTYLIEVKRPKGGKLTTKQVAFAAGWRGAPWIEVKSRAEALAVLGILTQGGPAPRSKPIQH